MSEKTAHGNSIWWALWGALLGTLMVWGCITALRSYEQRRAIATVEDLGCMVDVRRTRPAWLRDPAIDFVVRGSESVYRVQTIAAPLSPLEMSVLFNNLRVFPELRTLRIPIASLSDSDLKRLKELSRLDALDLNHTAITDEGLATLTEIPRLEWLALDSTRITDRGLAHLGTATGLRMLSLENTAVTDDGLEALPALARLEKVYLNGTRVTDDGVDKLQEKMPTLKVFR